MKKNIFMCAVLSAMVATSCTNEMEKGTESLSIKTKIAQGDAPVTRAGITAGNFANGEKLGLFLYTGDLTGEYDSFGSGKTKNVVFTETSGDWVAGSPIALSNKKAKVFAYYPYNVANDSQDGTAIPMTVKAVQGTGVSSGAADDTQVDYMYAEVVENVSNTNPTAVLTMKHALAMVSFKFKRATGTAYPGAGTVNAIALKNKAGKTAIKAGDVTFNISTGAITATAATAQTIGCAPNQGLLDVSTDATLPKMLVLPANVASDDAEVTFTVDGQEYTVALPATNMQAGNRYEYTVNVSGTTLSITSVAITPWNKVAGGDINIQ